MTFFTEPMMLLTSIVLDEKTDEVVKKLLELGVMEFVEVGAFTDGNSGRLTSRPSEIDSQDIYDFRKRLESVMTQGGLSIPLPSDMKVEMMKQFRLEDYQKLLKSINDDLSAIKERQKNANQRFNSLSEIRKYIDDKNTSYLDFRVGYSDDNAKLISRLSESGYIAIEKDGHVGVLALRRDSSALSELLVRLGWVQDQDPKLQSSGMASISDEVVARIDSLRKENENLDVLVKKEFEKYDGELREMWTNLRLHELTNRITSTFRYTKNTSLFSGWVPKEYAPAVERTIKEVTDGQCILEWTSTDNVERKNVPVSMKQNSVLSPFDRMVKNYGNPEYGSVNPVPFVAIAYFLMFGLMFADVGQGLILLLIGLFKKFDYRKHPLKKDGMINRNVANLMVIISFSSMLFGVLFGSYFGFGWFPALWFNFHGVVNGHVPAGSAVQSVYDILGITIKFGIGVLYTGLIINWINLARKKRYVELCLDKNGLCGGILFGVGLYLGFGFVATNYKSFPDAPWTFPVIGICAFLMFFKEILEWVEKKKEGKEVEKFGKVLANNFMEWLVSLLEVFSGFLSNTLSFMRIAGLGIAHVSLMTAFQTIAELLGGPLSAGGIFVLVIGNLLVIALEGLSAGIQSLRLNYYEFFSKYFTGKGIAYTPVNIESKNNL